MGQLLQRLKLNMCGQQGGDYKNSCKIWTFIWVVVLVVCGILASYTRGPGLAVYYATIILMVVALTKTRYYVRTKWSIPAEGGGGGGGGGGGVLLGFWTGRGAGQVLPQSS